MSMTVAKCPAVLHGGQANGISGNDRLVPGRFIDFLIHCADMNYNTTEKYTAKRIILARSLR